MGPGEGQQFEECAALVSRRSGKCQTLGLPCRSSKPETMSVESMSSSSPPLFCAGGPDSGEPNGDSVNSQTSHQEPEINLSDRLRNAAMLDIESNDFSWDDLSSLYHTKHTSSTEHSEDELNKALEVTVNSGGVIFYVLFNAPKNGDLSPKEAAGVIKIASSRMATQSERLGYEFAKWLGVRTPQGRVIHNSSSEWQKIKDAAEKARLVAVTSEDEVGEMTCSEMLEALELNRCLFIMNYIHGSPLLENPDAFDTREAAENAAAALGRVLMLDLILRNEDRLPCRQLGWRGNYANILFANKVVSANMDALEEAHDSAIRRYKPQIMKSLQKERRAISVNGRLGSHNPELMSESSDASNEMGRRSTKKQATDEAKRSDFYIVAIDSGVPRRPPAGKRAKDQENYPKVVELVLNNWEYSSNLLYEVSVGKLGFPGPEEADVPTDSGSCLSDSDMVAVVTAFRGGFRAALRDLQCFHIFLLTLYQKLDGLLRILLLIINKCLAESDKDDSGVLDSPSHSARCSFSSPFPAYKERGGAETHADSSDSETHNCLLKSSSAGPRECSDTTSPVSRDNWNGRYFKGCGEPPRCLRLTMKLRDFNKCAKVDAELSKELEQWNEMLRMDVVKLCQENNFNTGFFEGNDNNITVDAYELKVRLEHILERIALISDAASTERPSPITEYLFIGGALAARSMYTLQHLGVTHILCLCTNEIGQSDSQYPDHFEYRNFSISDNDDEDISHIFEDASDFIDYVEHLGGKVLVHCFEGRSRSATVVLAYLMLRKKLTLLEAWNKLKKVHRRAQPNDGFAKTLLDLDKRLHGKVSMEWQQKKPMMKVCPMCGKNAGLSSSSLKLHLQKSHRKISSGSVDSAMTLEIQKALEALKISRGGMASPTQKQCQSFVDGFSH
ncbi:dual specificity protein phosphatase PHS1-like isoform X1 [Phoenix dactylifera]|uniref:Dual specificity protein phosphatase PHS1-like isoform X1 n=2 Tax=Phoenix dactylifera TaxID=42345 RepID=A0A8B8ZIV4_PHODC|nr:dual specificity protein phosphatase PHS1-like isoform X1 [Phoenix dactylifera]XP_038974115.1 dual specificity protein phosphatase PHS1-like isoform X1 [Phoenix dactylifera]